MKSNKGVTPLGVPRNAKEVAEQCSDLLAEFDIENPIKVCQLLVDEGLFRRFNPRAHLPRKMTCLTALAYLRIDPESEWSRWRSFIYFSFLENCEKTSRELPARAQYAPKLLEGGTYSKFALYDRRDILRIDDHWKEVFQAKRKRPIIDGIKDAFEIHLRRELGRHLAQLVKEGMMWPVGLPRTSEELYRQYGSGGSSYMHQVLRHSKFVGSEEDFRDLMQDIWRRLLQAHILERFAVKLITGGKMSTDPAHVAKCFRGYLKAAMLRHFANWVRDRKRHYLSEFVQSPIGEDNTPWEDEVTVPFPGAEPCEDYGPEEVAEFVRLLDHHGRTFDPHIQGDADRDKAQKEGDSCEVLLENVLSAVEQGYTLTEAVRTAARVKTRKQMGIRLARMKAAHG
jgi:hypothetical protein